MQYLETYWNFVPFSIRWGKLTLQAYKSKCLLKDKYNKTWWRPLFLVSSREKQNDLKSSQYEFNANCGKWILKPFQILIINMYQWIDIFDSLDAEYFYRETQKNPDILEETANNYIIMPDTTVDTPEFHVFICGCNLVVRMHFLFFLLFQFLPVDRCRKLAFSWKH